MILEDLLKFREDNSYSNIFKRERWLTVKEAYALYFLLQEHKIQRYIECGTANGFSSSIAGLAIETGDVHTWDIVERPKVWDIDQFCAIPRPKCYLESFSPNATEIIKALPFVLRKAFFIDGNHHRDEVRKDWRIVKNYMTDKDIVIFHDTLVYEEIADMIESISTYETYIVSKLKTERGMAVIRKWEYL